MLDRKQRNRVIELFEDGVKASEIANQIGVSRQSVYNVIRDDFKKDPELIGLEKELKKTKLKKQIEELKTPIKTKEELAKLADAIDALASKVQIMWRFDPEMEMDRPQFCIYCSKELEYCEWEEKKGAVTPGFRCKHCKRVFPFPFALPF